MLKDPDISGDRAVLDRPFVLHRDAREFRGYYPTP